MGSGPYVVMTDHLEGWSQRDVIGHVSKGEMMLKRFSLVLAMAILALGALAACGGGGGGGNGEGENGGDGESGSLAVTMTDNVFEPATLSVSPGQEVTIELTNDGATTHDFTIDDVGGQQVQTVVEPGQSGTVTFTAPSEAGTIEFYCAQPGHRATGMEGTIEVK